MKLIFSFLIFLVVPLAFAQSTSSLSIIESPPFEDDTKAEDFLIMNTSSGGLSGVVRQARRDFVFETFDSDLNRVFQQKFKRDKKEFVLGNLYSNGVIILVTVLQESSKERLVNTYRFDVVAQSISKELLLEQKKNSEGFLFGGTGQKQVYASISPSGEYFVLVCNNLDKNSNAHKVFVFETASLRQVYTQTFEDQDGRYFEPNDITVDDQGAVFFLGKQFEKLHIRLWDDAEYFFRMVKMTKKDTEILDLSLNDEQIKSLRIVKSDLSRWNLIGLYSEKEEYKAKGICNFIFNPDAHNIIARKKFDLPVELYQDIYGDDRGERKSDKELVNFQLNHALKSDDGSFFLTAEETYLATTYVGMTAVTKRHFDDILVLKFDSLGDFVWGRGIVKRATEPSYNAFVLKDALHIIFNSGSQLSEKDDGRIKASRSWLESSALYDYHFSPEGEVLISKLQENKDNTFYSPKNGSSRNNAFVMMNMGKRFKRFMILK